MDDTAWAELEIARTDDQAAIRRAYAARLKAIGADRDSAAFMRLRRAYEEALAGASVSAADEDEEDDGGASPAIDDELTLAVPARRASAAQQMAGWPEPSIERAAGSEIVLPYGAFDRFRQVFEERIAASDTLGAAGSLKTALAEGIVTIGGERELVRALAICGLADTALTLDEIEEIGRTFQAQMAGRGDSILEPLRCLLARAEALRWQARILRDARLGDSWVIGPCPERLHQTGPDREGDPRQSEREPDHARPAGLSCGSGQGHSLRALARWRNQARTGPRKASAARTHAQGPGVPRHSGWNHLYSVARAVQRMDGACSGNGHGGVSHLGLFLQLSATLARRQLT
jgi:hypothetical protein